MQIGIIQTIKLEISGFLLAANNVEKSLMLKALFKNTDVKLVEPLVKDYLSEISGNVSGLLNIEGTMREPVITGTLNLERNKFKINYTQCEYMINDKLYFEKNKIYLSNARIYDQFLNQGILNGIVEHYFFNDFKFSLDCKFQNFEIINTTKKNNDLYYGHVFSSGNFGIKGSVNELNLIGDLVSEKNTKFTISLNSQNYVSKNDFIAFKVKNKTIKTSDSVEDKSKFKLKMFLNMNLTRDAEIDIIFDEVSGDALTKCAGEGRVQLEIDDKGDFNMYGKYTISQGKYNFTYLNLIRKEFIINENSTITWNGDPDKGIVNLTASLEKFSPLTAIVRGGRISPTDSALLARRYPTILNMKLGGIIVQPDIDFTIDIKQTPPEINNYVREFKNLISTNEQELNRQVLSLLLLGHLSPESSFRGQAFLGNSISELISGQLSDWVNQIDDELTIDVNINTLDYVENNALRFKLSRTFLDKRLKVMVEDGVNQNRNVRANPASMAGDWTIEYLLLPSGILRIKMFNRTTQNLVTAGLQQSTNTSAGASLVHSQEFDRLFKRRKKKLNRSSKEVFKSDD